MQFALFQTPVILAFFISSILIIYTWRYRQEKGIWAFIGLLTGVMFWSFFYRLELASLDLSRKLLFAKIEYLGIVMIPASWLLFVAYYTEQGTAIIKRWHLLLIEPILVIAFVWTNDYHNLIWDEWALTQSSIPTLDLTYGVMGWLNIFYAYTLFLTSLFLIIRAINQTTGLYRNQLKALLASFFIPWVGNALYISRISPYVDLSSFGFALSGLIVTWAILRFKFLDVMPIAYKLLIQNLTDGILVLDEKYTILDINQAARTLLNVQQINVIGKSTGEVFSNWQPLLRKYVGQTSIEEEFVIDADTENPKYLEIRLKSIYDRNQVVKAQVVNIRDITPQREKEAILKRHALLFENTTDAVAFTNTNDTIYDCNAAHEELFGYTRMEMIGKTPEVWHKAGEYPFVVEQILAGFAKNRRWVGEFAYVHKNGHEGVCEGTIVPIRDSKGTTIGQIRFLRDITQRREAEKLMRQAKETAERANKAKSLFLANVSHELRTPLTAIIGYAELIELEMETASPEEILHDLQKIQNSSDHLLNIVNGILNLARIEAQEVELMLDTVDISSLLEEISGTFRPLLKKNQNELVIEYPADIGKIYSDSTRINQILINLLTNANKFTKNGKLKLWTEHVQVDDAKWMHFKVSDTGIGIPQKFHEAIFEPFNQVDNSYTRVFGGTGLGLTITKAYCKLLQGDISVESEEGQGTLFTVKLPVQYAHPKKSSTIIPSQK